MKDMGTGAYAAVNGVKKCCLPLPALKHYAAFNVLKEQTVTHEDVPRESMQMLRPRSIGKQSRTFFEAVWGHRILHLIFRNT